MIDVAGLTVSVAVLDTNAKQASFITTAYVPASAVDAAGWYR